MPSRLIRESICTSATLAKLSAEGERLFYRLLVKADDHGFFEADPQIVRCGCFVRRVDALPVEKVAGWLNELGRAGLVGFYRVGDRPYGRFLTFTQHQRIRAKHSKWPQPPDSCELASSIDGHLPSRDQHMPADDGHMPADDGHMPADDGHMPADDGHMPADDVTCCSEAEAEAEAKAKERSDTKASDRPRRDRSGLKAPEEYPADWPGHAIAAAWMGQLPRLADAQRRANELPTWLAELDKLNRIDGVPWEDIRRLTEFIAADVAHGAARGQWAGWANNCQSPAKLRHPCPRSPGERYFEVIQRQMSNGARSGQPSRPSRPAIPQECP